MLLDDYLPTFDVRARYATHIAASPELVYACLHTADFDHWGITRVLYALRVLPTLATAPRETWRRFRAELRPQRETLDDLLARGFTLLGERPDEELLLGTVGIFWRARSDLRPTDPVHFRGPVSPGTAKAAWNFTVRPRPDGGTDLRTEIRVLCADAATRRRFHAYWLLIRPAAGLIRREMLAAVRTAAEAVRCDRSHPALPVIRARALIGASVLMRTTRKYAAAQKLGERALAIGGTVHHRRTVATALDTLARIAESQGDTKRARDRYEEQLALRRAMHDDAGITEVLRRLGELARHRGE